MIPFADYALTIRGKVFPSITTRSELLEFMGGDPAANLLWSEYIEWQCKLRPRHCRSKISFRAWLRGLARVECTGPEWSFIADVQRDKYFPAGGLDRMSEYLLRSDAHPSTLDSLESLWVRYNLRS